MPDFVQYVTELYDCCLCVRVLFFFIGAFYTAICNWLVIDSDLVCCTNSIVCVLYVLFVRCHSSINTYGTQNAGQNSISKNKYNSVKNVLNKIRSKLIFKFKLASKNMENLCFCLFVLTVDFNLISINK